MLIETDAYWHEQIHSVMHDLNIERYELHQEGLVNDVVIVNQQWVIRFTKTAWGRELMAIEGQLMTYLYPRLSLQIPRPEKRDEGVMVYPLLPGHDFLRDIWMNAPEQIQQEWGDQLGQFLWELHTTPTKNLDWEIPPTLAPVTRETWQDIYERVVEKIFPILLPHQVDWMEELFGSALGTPHFFDFESVIIHGDLAPYHILFSPQKQNITGVIDFGVSGLGDPATDLGSLMSCYGESLVQKIKPYYPNYEALLPRARFYAQASEVQWVLLGVESGEAYWFTAHLGGARDIWG